MRAGAVHCRMAALAGAMLWVAVAAMAAAPGQPVDPASAGAQHRNDPATLARARSLLALRSDRPGRVRALHAMRETDRPAWAVIAADIGFSTQDLEWLLALRAQRRLVNEHRVARCWLDSGCDPFAPIDGWVDPADDLPGQLGRERFERYQQFITARDERAYLMDLQRRSPAGESLPDAAIEQITAALAEGRARFAAEARRQGMTVQARLTGDTVAHLWSGYLRGAADEYPDRQQSAARYAAWLQDVAARHLSTAQQADLKAMLERELQDHAAWLEVDAIRQAQRRAANDPRRSARAGPPRKNPDAMARADFRISDRNFQVSEVTRINEQARKDWHERAALTLLRLTPGELDRLAFALGTLEHSQALAMLHCITDPDCDESALHDVHREARSAEVARLLGPEEFAHFSRASDADHDVYYLVAEFRAELPEDQPLEIERARKLAAALVVAKARPRDGDAPVTERSRRLHEAAAGVLGSEQLRLFDAMLERDLDQ